MRRRRLEVVHLRRIGEKNRAERVLDLCDVDRRQRRICRRKRYAIVTVAEENDVGRFQLQWRYRGIQRWTEADVARVDIRIEFAV